MKIQNLLESYLPTLNLYSIHTFNNTDDYITGMIVLQDKASDWKYSFDIEIDKATMDYNISEFEVRDRNDSVVAEPDDENETYREAYQSAQEFITKYIRSIVSRMERSK